MKNTVMTIVVTMDFVSIINVLVIEDGMVQLAKKLLVKMTVQITESVLKENVFVNLAFQAYHVTLVVARMNALAMVNVQKANAFVKADGQTQTVGQKLVKMPVLDMESVTQLLLPVNAKMAILEMTAQLKNA